MRRRLLIAGFATVLMACAVVAACTGDDPVLTPARDGGDETSATADGGPDAKPQVNCGARDTTPCGCPGSKSCCIGRGVADCYPSGQEPEDAAAGCTSTTIVRCVATSCGANQACCFNGDVTGGDVCSKRLTSFDTECVSVDVDAADPYPCINTSNSSKKAITCLVDADCAKFDAGTCVSALMDTVMRVIGVCTR